MTNPFFGKALNRATGELDADSIRSQIDEHEKHDDNQSLLSQGTNYVISLFYDPAGQSLAALKNLETRAKANPNDPALQKKITEAVERDRQGLQRQSQVGEYAKNTIKAGALFLNDLPGGKALTHPWVGRAAASLLWGCDQVKLNDDASTQALDFTCGAAKGLTLKLVSDGIGRAPVLPSMAKGILTGSAFRIGEVGFDRKTWFDETSGKVDIRAGMDKVGTLAASKEAIGADIVLFGMAGALGATVGKGLNNSPFWGTVSSSSAFGFSSGFQREFHTQINSSGTIDWRKLLASGLLQAGLDGIAGIPGGLQRSSAVASQRLAEAKRASETKTASSLPLLSSSLSERMLTSSAASDRRGGEPILLRFPSRVSGLEHLNITLPERQAVPLAEQGANLGAYQRETMSIPVRNAAKARECETSAEFSRSLESRERPVRVYELKDSGISVVVPEEYAAKLDAVRDLRLKAAASNGGTDNSVRELDANPLKDRLLPEEIGQLINTLPDKSLVKRVVLLDEVNPHDDWVRANGRPDFTSAASSNTFGDIVFYKKNFDRFAPEEMLHEWAHLLRNQRQHHAYLFDLASMVERDGHYARPHAETGHGENWAVHLGEQILNSDGGTFGRFVQEAPVRATVLGLALKQSMLFGENPGSLNTPLQKRIEYIEQHALPQARQIVTDFVNNAPDPRTAQLGMRLLVPIATPETMASVKAPAEIDLSHMQLTDDAVSSLAGLKQATKLDLSNTLVTSDGLQHIAALPLTELSLAKTKVTNSGLSYLEGMKTLNKLNLSGTMVTNEGLFALSELPNLRNIDATGTRVDRAGADNYNTNSPQVRVRVTR